MNDYSNLIDSSVNSLIKKRRDIIGPTGPTGPTGNGDRFLCITKQRITKLNLLNEQLIPLTIDKYLSYNKGDNIIVKSIDLNEYNVFQEFIGEVKSYDRNTGILVIKDIQNVSELFYNDSYNYKISLNNVGYTGPTGPTGESGDKYITINKITILTSDVFFDRQVAILIEAGLSYFQGDNVQVVSLDTN